MSYWKVPVHALVVEVGTCIPPSIITKRSFPYSTLIMDDKANYAAQSGSRPTMLKQCATNSRSRLVISGNKKPRTIADAGFWYMCLTMTYFHRRAAHYHRR